MNPIISSSSRLNQEALAGLQAIFGDRFSTAQSVREHHGRDESFYACMPPDAVAFALSAEEVAATAALCNAHRIPLIAFGAGSSVEGHLLAVKGGLAVDLSRMNRIVGIHAEDAIAVVEPGVTRTQLNNALKDSGLFFPIDPGADATLGGMAATRASGTNAVRYGTMRDNVLALKVVTADGRIVSAGTKAKKSSAGYDLTRIFIGSEGTLGIITELTVKLYPLPEAVSAAVCSFSDVEHAITAAMRIMQNGIPVARIEFLDSHAVHCINVHCKLALPAHPLLLFEFHGSESSVEEQAEATRLIVNDHYASGFEWATRPEERSRLWTARHQAYFAILHSRPGARIMTTDCCVPISRLADCLLAARRDCEINGIRHAVIGHVGDGNFHVLMLVDPEDADETSRAEKANTSLVNRALEMGGTCTGEHGIGLHKIPFMAKEHSEDALDMMRSIKRAF
ncbi:MAG: linked oxidase, C-terminal domain protein, partial [Paucimonas sp.]|nr:linked oxidase, C-terminal domain protein [Paucimonas sp.]